MTLDVSVGTLANDHTGTNRRTAWQRLKDWADSKDSLQSQIVNAGDVRFAGYATTEARIQAAINQAILELATTVFVPAFMLPYDATQVMFNTSIKMMREGGDWTVYDARAYGAAGDGTTDDTAELQATLTAAAASTTSPTAFIPSGTYLVTAQLSLGGGITFRGVGRSSKIIITNQAIQNCVYAVNASNVTIRDLFFYGPGTNHTDVNTTACLRFDTATSTNVRIENCDFERWDDALLVQDATGFVITTNRFAHCSGAALLASNLTFSQFENNSWDGTRVGIGNGISGQSLLAFAESAALPGQFTHHVSVVGNNGSGFSADMIFCQGHHCTVTGNTLDTGTSNGITFQAGFNETVGQPVQGGSFNNATGNVVKGAANDGVVIQASPGNAYAAHNNVVSSNIFDACGLSVVLTQDAAENTITDNEIRNSTSHGILCATGGTQSRNNVSDNVIANGAATGISWRAGTGNRIAGNIVYLNKDDGIAVIGGTDSQFLGNICQDNDALTQGFRFGINVTGGTRICLRDNKCFCSNTAAFQNLGINIAAGATDTECVQNDCRNNRTTTNGLANAGTRTYLRGNQRVAGGILGGQVNLAAANPAATVSTTEVLAGDTIIVTRLTAGGTLGHLSIGTITANTSFTILASGNAETSTVAWEIVH